MTSPNIHESFEWTQDALIEISHLFMKTFGHDNGRLTRMDHRELETGSEWQTMMVKEFKYLVEPTGADSPTQNEKAEQ
jgi:hypothetical protein